MEIPKDLPIQQNWQDSLKISRQADKARKAIGAELPDAPVDKVDLNNTPPTRYKMTDGNYVEALTNGQQIMSKISETIEGASKSVQVQMYRLGHPKLVDLLVSQAKSGNKVQVLLDPSKGYDEEDAKKQEAMKQYLKANGVEVLHYPIDQYGKIDHVKMLIVDGKSLIIGGMNWDKHSPENQDSDVFIRGPVVKDALDVFENDWKIAGGKKIPGLEPPGPQPDANASVRMLTTETDAKDINTALQENIQKAKKFIYMEAFVLSDEKTIQNLIDAKQKRNVDVKVILDPNKPTYFVNLKSAAKLTKAGVDVRWFDVDAANQQKLHSKLAVFDEDKIIIGSCNFTKAGLEVNHEANVEIISKAVGDSFVKLFQHHWENQSLQEPPKLPDFYEKPSNQPFKEQIAKELFRYFEQTFNPNSEKKIVWRGKKKDTIVDYANSTEINGKAQRLEVLKILKGKDDANVAETVGKLASFFSEVKNFDVDPKPGDNTLLFEARQRISENAAAKVYKSIPGYINDMVGAIKDKEIRQFVKDAFEKAPVGFYEAPSSSSGSFHPADEVAPETVIFDKNKVSGKPYKGGGLVLHSRRNQVMASELCNFFGIKGREKDEILAAIALHDVMKSVKMEDMKKAMEDKKEIPWGRHTEEEHGKVAAEWIRMMDTSPDKKLTKNIARLVENHMGIWNKPNPTPPNDIPSFIVSISDYIVSQKNFYLKV